LKKLILGLFLTVGTTASVLANTISAYEDSENYHSEMSLLSIDNNVEMFADCTYRYETRWYNCTGGFKTIVNPSFTAPCNNGNTEGTIIVVISRVDGCPQGSPSDSTNNSASEASDSF